jgi:hypothetical protein
VVGALARARTSDNDLSDGGRVYYLVRMSLSFCRDCIIEIFGCLIDHCPWPEREALKELANKYEW